MYFHLFPRGIWQRRCSYKPLLLPANFFKVQHPVSDTVVLLSTHLALDNNKWQKT